LRGKFLLHSKIGDNYRLSNVVAAIERGQLRVLEARAQWAPEARRHKFDYDQETLGHLPGIGFRAQWAPAPGREAAWGRHTRWLTCMIVDPLEFGATREDVRLALEATNIEARPVWKPMHLGSPLGAIFAGYETIGGAVAEALFTDGLCLPSGPAVSPAEWSNLTEAELERVVAVVRRVYQAI